MMDSNTVFSQYVSLQFYEDGGVKQATGHDTTYDCSVSLPGYRQPIVCDVMECVGDKVGEKHIHYKLKL